MSHATSALQIVRPLNIVLTFTSALLGGWLAVHSLSFPALIAAISAASIAAAGYIHNDIADLEVDRISHPFRPLPAGALSPSLARTSSFLAALAGLTLTIRLPVDCQLLASAIIILLILYNLWLKHLPLVGNLTVGLIGGAPFIFGGVAAGRPDPTILPAAFAALFHFCREILKDIQDRSGDESTQSRTFPMVAGEKMAKWLISILLTGLVIVIPVPAFMAITGPIYLVVGLLLCALLILTVCLIWQSPGDRQLEVPSRILKAGMIVGILAFLLDSLAS
jgi:geranylgeranylglycerol-phosphate geranylgeranyltransferase